MQARPTETSNGTENETETTTPIESPLPVSLKHPLNSSWTFWYYVKNTKTANWEDNQIEVASFSTVEDFWALFNHIEDGSRLKPGCDYSLFKTGVKPMWEDEANKLGGKWDFTSPVSRRCDIDHLFLETIMMLIGENHDETLSNELTGMVLSIRMKGDRLAVWTRTGQNEKLVLSIGEMIKDCLGLPPKQLEYKRHADTSHYSGKRGGFGGKTLRV